MKYVIGGGVASVFIVYAILMVLGSIGGSGAIELLALLLLMALPGMIAGAFYAGREKQEKEHAELKRELADLRAMLERRDEPEDICPAEQTDDTPGQKRSRKLRIILCQTSKNAGSSPCADGPTWASPP